MGDSPSATVRGLNLDGEEDLLSELEVVQDARILLAQRRSLAVPAALDTGSTSSLTPSSGATILSPKMSGASPMMPTTPSASGVRRRTSLAEPDSPLFLPPSPSFAPSSPRTDASLHLQQARAGIASTAGQESRRLSLFGTPSASSAAISGTRRTSAAAHLPPPAPSSGYRHGAPASNGKVGHTSNPLPSTLSSDTIKVTQSDLRRPSFLSIGVSNTSHALSWRPRLFLPSRRMQKTVRLWFLAALSLYFFMKLINTLGLSPSNYRSMMTELRESAKLRGVGALDQLPPGIAHLVELIPRPNGWAAQEDAGGKEAVAVPVTPQPFPSNSAQKPFRVEIGKVEPNEGEVVEAEQARREAEQMGWTIAPEDEERASRELVLPTAELALMRKNRREKLWAPPEEDLWVEIVKPKKNHLHESTVIFLTGLGEKAADAFLPIHLHKRFPTARWVMPQSPTRPVTALGASHPAWFDMRDFPYDPISDRDYEGLFASVRAINRVIAEERALLIRNLRRRGGGAAATAGLSSGPKIGDGYATSLGPDGEDGADEEFGTPEERAWASKRIVLGGFSQGSVVSLLAGLTHKEQLGGIIVISGFLPLREDLSKLIVDLEGRKDMPVFWGHGWNDPYLLFTDALTSVSLLQPAALPHFDNPAAVPAPTYLDHPSYRLNLTHLTFSSYVGLEHTFDWDELADIATFLDGVLPRGAQRGERIPRSFPVAAPESPPSPASILPPVQPPQPEQQQQPVVQVPAVQQIDEAAPAGVAPGGGMRKRRKR
ncbi:hypothetical protein JCM8547_002459 [Rhodosporidiobolus lusitaniae]